MNPSIARRLGVIAALVFALGDLGAFRRPLGAQGGKQRPFSRST